MRTPNYGYERRQRELDKQKKKEEKRLSKLAKKQACTHDVPDSPSN